MMKAASFDAALAITGMSGVGTKAGGPDYLQHFMVPRAVSENTMRRGFAPTE